MTAPAMQRRLDSREMCFTSGGFAMSPSSAPKKACKPCRERHLKCDRALPVCSTCQKSRYLQECTYDTTEIRFRTSLAPLPALREERDGRRRARSSPHPVEPEPGRLAQTPRSADSHVSDNSGTPVSCEASQPVHPLAGSPTTPTSHASPPDRPDGFGLLTQAISAAPEAADAPQPSVAVVLEHDTPSSVQFPGTSCPSFTSSPPGLFHSISDRTEARIFDFYLSNAGSWVRCSCITLPGNHNFGVAGR